MLNYKKHPESCPDVPDRFSDLTELSSELNPDGAVQGIELLYHLRLEGRGSGIVVNKVLSRESFFLPRGQFRVKKQILVIRDSCRFFRIILKGLHEGHVLTVYPEAREQNLWIEDHRPESPDKKVLYSPFKDRALSDARPYVSGDDPRRIHWKMLARHDELFVRDGNGRLPSRNRILAVLSSSDSCRKDGTVRDDYALIFRTLAGELNNFMEQGFQVDVLLPGETFQMGVESLSEKERQDLWASVPPGFSDYSCLPGGSPYKFLCVFQPGTAPLEILERLDAGFPDSRKILVQCCLSEQRGIVRRLGSLLRPSHSASPRKGWVYVQA